MTTVHLDLRDSTPDGDPPPDAVDLDQLTPMARALAESIAADFGTRTTVCLESRRTLAELADDEERLLNRPGARDHYAFWYGSLDQPHRIPWSAWSSYPPGSDMSPIAYLESQAQKLPIGYVPVGVDWRHPVPSSFVAADEAEMLAKGQVLELLRAMGRPISATTLDNYRSPRRAPTDWPQPARYVGRTPLWRRSDIEAYARRAGDR